MEEFQKLRIKTSMIVFALEEGLGSYVIENEDFGDDISPNSKNSIVNREHAKGNVIKNSDIKSLVEASYLNEIFDFAIDLAQGTSKQSSLEELKIFCSTLGIFDIRNAISHPNRPFPECYWYRAATIASDPLIEKCNLHTVTQSLNLAVQENLNPPPEDWINNVKWAIPNTLPDTFDHEITGLLGREREFQELKNVLSKARNNLIAVVAPGGIGKTALILQFLRDLSLSPEWNTRINAILFCTLKNEVLTAEGIEVIEAIDGIDQVTDVIFQDLKKLYSAEQFSNFEEACEVLKEEKILICIDNLETLLIKSQKEFIEFNESLPLHWRVLVTSRISIDSATTVPLEPLIKRHAVTLSRSYMRKRGIIDFKQEELEKIADAANNNPLAIRLTIDLYIKRGDISQSIHRSQKDIASFSFKNLIESLSAHSISILEAVYETNQSTKSELIDLLDLNNEEITQSINELLKTSLLLRITEEFGNDSYKLSESIRDLLLTNPKNIEVRSLISDNLKKRKAKILEQSTRNKQLGLSEFDEEFVHDNTEAVLYGLIVDINKYLTKPRHAKNHNELIALKARYDDLFKYKAADAQILFHYSRILRELKDKGGELKYLQKANEMNPESPRIGLAIALRYFYSSDYEEALIAFEELRDRSFDSPEKSTRKFSFTVTKLHLLCLLYLGRYDQIRVLTDDWQASKDWRAIYGVYRASALKRSLEHTRAPLEECEQIILDSLVIFDEIFKSENYPDFACIEANKLLKEVNSIAFNKNNRVNFKKEFALFIANHFFNIISVLKSENINSAENQRFLEKVYNWNIPANPLHYVKWYKINKGESEYDKDHIDELISEGYSIVNVYHIPEDKGFGMSSFLFAEDREKNQFYLSVNNFEGGWNRWGYIEEDIKLAIKYSRLQSNGKPTPAEEIVEIEKY